MFGTVALPAEITPPVFAWKNIRKNRCNKPPVALGLIAADTGKNPSIIKHREL